MSETMLAERTGEAPAFYATLRRWIDALDSVLVTLGCTMLFGLMCLVVADVASRYALNAPISWAYEVINNYLMPGLFFLAVSHTLKAHSHVSVDILHNYVGTRTRYWFETIAMVLAAPAFALCAWVSAGHTLHEFQTDAQSSTGLPIPSWTISIGFPIGFGMLTLRVALNAVGYIATLATGRVIKELPPISGTEGAE